MIALHKTRGFIPLVMMMFLNAFIDLGHKITIQNTLFKLYDGSEQIILTAIINAFILLPYILFFRPAGKTSDNHSKTRVLRATAIACLVIMAAIAVCYWQGWFWPAFFLTLLLALQSAYYGPAKLGYLKELVSNEQLKRANGVAQSLLMVAILSGIFIFSMLFENYYTDALAQPSDVIRSMTPLALILVVLAMVECYLAWMLPHIPKPDNTLETPATVHELVKSPIHLPILIGLCVFWSVGQMLLAVYPAFAKENLGITNAMLIQGILAMIAIGIMLGALLDGLFSRQFIELKLLPISGIIVMMIGLILPFNHSIVLAGVLFLLMGIAGGILVVPLNALMQFCTLPDKLGITLAQANLLQNIAMLSCLLITVLLSMAAFPAATLLLLIAVVSCLGLSSMLYLMPQTRAALFNKQHIEVQGFNQLRGYGPVLLVADNLDKNTERAIRHSYPRELSLEAPAQWDEHSCVLLCKDALAMAHFDHAALQAYRVQSTQEGNKIALQFSLIKTAE